MSSRNKNVNTPPFSKDNYLNRCKRFKLDPISTTFSSPARLKELKDYISSLDNSQLERDSNIIRDERLIDLNGHFKLGIINKLLSDVVPDRDRLQVIDILANGASLIGPSYYNSHWEPFLDQKGSPRPKISSRIPKGNSFGKAASEGI